MSECKHRKPNGVCVKEVEVVYRGYCVDGPCDCFEPQTNADRIRAMSDEELAKWHKQIIEGYCPVPTSECRSECKGCWLDWLKQEAKT